HYRMNDIKQVAFGAPTFICFILYSVSSKKFYLALLKVFISALVSSNSSDNTDSFVLTRSILSAFLSIFSFKRPSTSLSSLETPFTSSDSSEIACKICFVLTSLLISHTSEICTFDYTIFFIVSLSFLCFHGNGEVESRLFERRQKSIKAHINTSSPRWRC